MRTALVPVIASIALRLALFALGALIAFVAALIVGVFSARAEEPPEPLCAPRQAIVAALAKHYAQVPVWTGLPHAGDLMELFASRRGSWTIVITDVDGRTCILGGGTDATFTPPPAGDPS